MQRVLGREASRVKGMRPARKVLALALMGVAFTLTFAQPAWAYTISRSDTQIVVTSERLSDITVHVTESWTLRSNGQVTYKVDVHNSGRTRKFYFADAWVSSPATGVYESYPHSCHRVERDDYDSWSSSWVDPEIYPNWARLRDDPGLKAYFHLDAQRIGGC